MKTYASTRERSKFPFLFGGTFIEGEHEDEVRARLLELDFPSFSEGLSLRGNFTHWAVSGLAQFPFLFGGTFIEGVQGSCLKL